MTPEQFMAALDEHIRSLCQARDFVRSLIDFAPEINTGAENQIKQLIRDRIEAAADAIDALTLT